jgi:redox-sensing transcriptional repressor
MTTKESKIPDATIGRIALYSRPLEKFLEQGMDLISSERLAALCNVNPAQVRKDLSYFGEFGVRGIGYNVRDLLREIRKILVSDREWKLAIAGVGNMGRALVENVNLLKRGYRFVAAFDSNPERIGKRLPSGLTVQPLTSIGASKEELGFEIGVITTGPAIAQSAADFFIRAGVRAILNFSAFQVRQPEGCLVENVDFSINLDDLAYHLSSISHK